MPTVYDDVFIVEKDDGHCYAFSDGECIGEWYSDDDDDGYVSSLPMGGYYADGTKVSPIIKTIVLIFALVGLAIIFCVMFLHLWP